MMSLLFNMLSSFVIVFLPRSKHLNFMAAVTVHSDFEAWENKIFAVSIFPHLLGPDAMIFIFLMLSFKPVFHSPFSLSSGASLVLLHFLPEKWYHLRIWGCCYFSWQSWFQLVLHPAWHFTWCYSVCKLNKQNDNKKLHCSMSSSNCWFLTCIQVSQEAGEVIWYSHL